MNSMPFRLLGIFFFAVVLLIFSVTPALALEAIPVARSPYSFTGIYSTDLFTGGVNYSYPIKVPKGANDLTPDVSLNYSSFGAHSFFSSTGTGWEVNRDYVERDINFTPDNGSTGDDKFKLHFKGGTYDLVYVSADSRYHTKTESYLNIQKLTGGSNDGSDYWQVIDKDGTKYRFGYLSNSERACNEHNYQAQWSLDKVEDIHGNNIVYTYTEDSYAWSVRLASIEYNNSSLHKVEFNYSGIPSERWQYNQGCDVSETYRLSNVTVKTNNTLVRQYDVAFTQAENNQSLLSSITEKGSDGSPLPPTTFTYNPEVKSFGSKEKWIDNVSLDTHLERPDTAMADVNGDGLIDIVKTQHFGGPNVSWMVLFNQGGNSWSTTFQTLINNVAMEDAQLERSDVRLLDVTGDNLPDIVMAVGADHWRVWRNTGGNWNTTAEEWADMRGNNSEINLNNPNVTIVDLTGDGLPDIVWARWDGRYVWDVWRNTGSSWSTTRERWSDQNTSGSYNNGLNPDDTMLVDANGDGLIDIVNTTHTGTQENSNDTWRVWRNTGSSFRTSNEVWINNANITAHFSIDSVGVADVNGDNLPDIVKVIDQGVHDEWKVLLNKGNSWSTTYETWIPGSANVDADFNGEDNVIIADATGDGLADIIKTGNDAYNVTWEVYRNNSKSPKMLSSVKSPEGATTAFDYSPSTKYANVGTDSIVDLTSPMWVASKKTVDNGMASGSAQKTTDVTNYSYANGMYDWQDREFRGFGNVFETLPNASKNTHVFFQDDIKKGKLDRTETADASNNLYTTTKNAWSSSTSNGVNTVNLTQEQEYTYDGVSSNPKITQIDYLYDSYGNVSKESDQGETSTSGDEHFDYKQYTYNTTAWIVNTPKNEYRLASNDISKVSERWFYYDGNTGLDDTPTKGDVTKEVKWLSGGTNPETTYAYDSYGNQTSVTDANNHTTTQTYDTTHTYPLVKTNAKSQTTTTTYDPGTGNLLSATDANGLTTSYAYDVFGRKTKDIKPYDSSTYPTTNYDYFVDGIAPEGVLVSKRKVSSESATLKAYTWSDGLSRKIQTRSDAENTAQQIVTDTTYDVTGEVAKETVPYSATLDTTYATPSSSIRFTGYTYDPIGRVTIVNTPDNKTKTTTYDHWKATDIDESGHIKRTFKNAHDKIAKVEEVNGVEIYTTNYEYNTNDQLTKIIDAATNENTISYDTLGRKTSQNDPDMGTWEYEYDGMGNITKQTDNRDVETTKTYDELNRIKKTDYPTDTDVTYAYDIGKIGILSVATDSAGTVKYSYDNRLRKTQEQRSVNGTTKTTQFSYDAADRTVIQTNPDGEVLTSAYNAQGEIESLTGSTAILSNVDYNPLGKITKKEFANGLSTDYTYNTTDFRLNRIQTGSVQDLNYTYDDVGNIKTITNAVTSKTQMFGYDDLDRLKTASESAGGYNQAYTYNAIGNLTKFTNNGADINYTYGENGKPHAVTSSTENASGSATPTPTPTPNVLVSENWSSGLNTSIWSDWGGAQTNVVSNEFQISSTTSPNYYGVDLANDYNLTNKTVTSQLVSAGNQSVNSWEAYPIYMEQAGNSANGIYWYVAQNKVWIQTRISGTDTFIDKGTYNSTNQKYFRIREASGMMYFETSANGTSWTSLHSLSNPFSITLMKIGFAGGTFVNESTTTTATFDNFTLVDNAPSSTPTPTPTSGPTATPTPTSGASTVTIWDETLASGWTDASYNTTNTTSTTQHYQGSNSISSVMNADGGLDFQSVSGKSTSGYTSVTFALKASQSGQQYEVYADSVYGEPLTVPVLLSSYGGQPSNSQWKVYTIPLADLGATNITLKDLVIHDSTSSNQAALYVDTVQLVSASSSATPTPTATPTPGGGSGTNYTYDANGNMTSNGQKCYHYNDANQMDKVTNCSNSQTIAEYVYDYTGQRMVKKNYSGGTMVNSVTSWSDGYETKFIVGGATENTAYYFANGQLIAKKDKDGNRTYVHSDHLGSTSVVTTQAGSVVESTSYDPWGEVKSGGTANKFMYTGQEKDSETGLHYYNARYYDPHIRRFIQPDDIVKNIYNPQDLNRYSYARNNPIKYTDPSGHAIVISGGKIVSTITILNPKSAPAKPTTVAQFVAAAKTQATPQKQQIPNNTNSNNGDGGSPPKNDNNAAVDVLKPVYKVANHTYNALLGNDIRAFSSSNSTPGERGLAGIGIGLSLTPLKLSKLLEGTRNLSGGEAMTMTILNSAEEWLRPGYKEIDKGVFRSADGVRQFRMEEGSLMDARQGPHVSFESIADDGRKILENTHVKILDP